MGTVTSPAYPYSSGGLGLNALLVAGRRLPARQEGCRGAGVDAVADQVDVVTGLEDRAAPGRDQLTLAEHRRDHHVVGQVEVDDALAHRAALGGEVDVRDGGTDRSVTPELQPQGTTGGLLDGQPEPV